MQKFFIFKKRLREIRQSKGLSRPQVSKETGIPIGTIEGWESRDKQIPLLDKIAVIAEFYNVSLDYIIGRTDNPEVNKETPKDNPKINK